MTAFYSSPGKVLTGQGEDTGERDADPGGAIVEFVEEFIEGLFEQVSVEQAVGLRRLWSEMGGFERR